LATPAGSGGGNHLPVIHCRNNPPFFLALQFQHPVVIVEQGLPVADTDIVNVLLLQQALQMGFVFAVQRTGGFIQHGKAGLMNQQPGKGQTLLFTQGEQILYGVGLRRPLFP
jgi:hypothetical protein